MNCRIRTAISADSPAVRTMIASVLAEFSRSLDGPGLGADLHDLDASYNRAGGVFYVVTDPAGGIVGSAGLAPVDQPGTAELRRMFLTSGYRGRGLGRRLLELILSDARRLGFARVQLQTSGAMQDARRLYNAAGFRIVPLANPTYQCDVGMALELSPGRSDGSTPGGTGR